MITAGCFCRITLFMTASLACPLVNTQGLCIIARVLRSLGGPVVTSDAVALIRRTLTGAAERAKPVDIHGFAAGGGTASACLSGSVRQNPHWHWIFMINLPILDMSRSWTSTPKGTGFSSG
jgi:MFS family permease